MNLKELSNLLGLSQTTVSRALNGYPEVAETTRQRIVRAASAAGYKPSQHARLLAGGRANAIGLIWYPEPTQPDDGLKGGLLRSLVSAGSVYGLHFVLIIGGHDGGLQESRTLSLRGMIDAVLLLDPKSSPSPDDWPVPIACLGRRPVSGTKMTWIDIDHEHTAYAAATFLFQLGHRRVVIVDDRTDRMQFYLAGARRALKQFNTRTEEGFAIDLEPVRRLWEMSMHERPTSFICTSLALAHEVATSASENRINVGRDISIVAYDEKGEETGKCDQPLFTVCRPNIDVVARRALEAVRSLIEPAAVHPINPLIRTELVMGASTGALAAV